MKTSLLTHTTKGQSAKSLKRSKIAALVSAAMIPVAFAATPLHADDMYSAEERGDAMERHSVMHDKGEGESDRAYTEIKRSSKEYWSEFKQDSEQTWDNSKAAFRDGWVEGKLETALILNEHLNPFKIDIEVDNNTATLKGKVGSEMDKELAENVALGIEGIDDVDNELAVVKDFQEGEPKQASYKSDADRGFTQYIDDITTTSAIKTELLASDNVSGMDINVDTRNNTVTLSGTVESEEQRELAERIASNHEDVNEVVNNLRIGSEDLS